VSRGRKRAGAEESLRRLLALVPWVAGRDGPRITEVCDRFGCTEAELMDDLELLFMCGLYPFTPDTLIEVTIEEGRVWIRYANFFARPLRLTPAEGLFLLAAGTTLMSVPGTDPDGPLGRGLAKLASALGVDGDEAVGVQLGHAPPEILAALQRAAAQHNQVEIDYYSYGRDEWIPTGSTTRRGSGTSTPGATAPSPSACSASTGCGGPDFSTPPSNPVPQRAPAGRTHRGPTTP